MKILNKEHELEIRVTFRNQYDFQEFELHIRKVCIIRYPNLKESYNFLRPVGRGS